ncbi:hypothetical protein [Sphingobacterium endophyticum]|uniref:hypothetical protein n=1 Tax=Sphingobacterium endophyticum TaxID=2546448 RepID=UPI0012E2D375|nr:hypothetical protein [Sphingobacterium endophyticum]
MLMFLSSCVVRNINRDQNHQIYSTGRMGMPGEFKFVFSEDNLFYYSQTVPGIYSEGYYKWISEDSISFVSRQHTSPSKEKVGVFNSISGKTEVLKGKKLYFNGLTYFLKVGKSEL